MLGVLVGQLGVGVLLMEAEEWSVGSMALDTFRYRAWLLLSQSLVSSFAAQDSVLWLG